MYKVDLLVDRSTDAAIERRRAAEAARKARIFNTRSRVIGLDLGTLDQQVEQKKQQQSMERQREKAFDELRRSHDEALVQQERDEEERRAALNRDLVQYRAVRQRVEESCDADLKCDLKGAFTLSIPEADLGPASMQVFQGEDLGEKEQNKAQMEKTERELRAQKEEKERRRMEDMHKEVFLGTELVHQDLRAVQLDALESECKKAAHIALSNYNHVLAAEHAQRLREQRTREEGEELGEVWHMVTSDMLTECPEAAERVGGRAWPARVLTDRWRGMTPEQLSAIHREREEQRLEKEKRREKEKLLDAAWDLQRMEQSRRVEQEEERREAELQRERKIQLDQYNKQLAHEQQAYQEYLNKQVYTNKPSAEYFGQFNTSSR